VEVMDVLPPDLVEPPQVVVTKREQLVERGNGAGVRRVVPAGEVVVRPDGRGPLHSRPVIPGPLVREPADHILPPLPANPRHRPRPDGRAGPPPPGPTGTRPRPRSPGRQACAA